MYACMYVCTQARVIVYDGWMDGWLAGWMDGWMGGCCAGVCLLVHIYTLHAFAYVHVYAVVVPQSVPGYFQL